MKNRLHTAVLCALILGVIGSIISKSAYSFETADWASRGQPIEERLADILPRYLPGFFAGALIGTLIGLCFSAKQLEKIFNFLPSRELKGGYKYACPIVTVAIAFPLAHSIGIENGYLQVGFLFLFFAPIYIASIFLFGMKIEENRSKQNKSIEEQPIQPPRD